jgi:ATP-binding cassette subfamily C (CFTR/MRP) protein 4
VLQNLTFKANAKELTLINGPPGCGKSSLLAAILGELPSIEGTVFREGKVAFVPQNPVIFTASFRDNIIFGRNFNPFRYQAVINACNLQKLVEKLPDGDLTIIGSQAIQLTDDQRARIGLGRAAYADADIYLLDDPLRLVDPKTAEQVFDKCICGLLSKRLRILVSRQLQYVERADQILTLRGGTIINEVTTPMMGYKPAKLHGVGYGNHTREGEKINNLSLRDEPEVVSTATHQATHDSDVIETVKFTTYWRFFEIGIWRPLILLCCLLFVGIQGRNNKG